MLKIHSVVQKKWLEEKINDNYKVSINGTNCPVYNSRVSAYPFNGYNGEKQRKLEQTEIGGFISFSSDEEVVLQVECAENFDKISVRPLSKHVEMAVKSNILTITLKESGQYTIEPYNQHKALHVFFNKLEDFDVSPATIYFGAGLHFPGLIRARSGDRIFIDEGAIVYGSLLGDNVENVQIYGHGVLDDSYEERLTTHCYEDYTKGNIRFYASKNISINGVILRNSAIWSCSFYDCSNININNIKIVGQWRYNADGIDLVNCDNAKITNSFIRSFDDGIVIKAIQKYFYHDVKNIEVDNCVVWCDWGRSLELGLETACAEYNNITFSNCDLIHNSCVAIDISGGDYALIHNIKFLNINVEYQTSTLPERIQQNPEAKYDAFDKMGVPTLIAFLNASMREMEMYKDLFTEEELLDTRKSIIQDVIVKNIQVYLEEGVPTPPINICSLYNDYFFKNITLENISFNNKKVTETQLNLNIKNVENFILK